MTTEHLTAYQRPATASEWALADALRHRVNNELLATEEEYLSVGHPLVVARDLVDLFLVDYDKQLVDYLDWLNLLFAVEELLTLHKNGNEDVQP